MDKRFFTQEFYLLITSLLTGIVGLVVYIWHGASRDTYRKMSKMEKCVESHNDRLIVLETEHEHNPCRNDNKDRRRK